ncbi:uncharacterized protein LOC130667164 [Microplitis mediator]|uniref:uncharacterized protein LOC130667164 n=1 Tax=Microplitis mediator TaxID=375433 RepID=UPI002556107C|nr:uncharacterized protein LOC130667164 [Microplitis mediator]
MPDKTNKPDGQGDAHHVTGLPTSEVGSGSSTGVSAEQFSLLLEAQNRNLIELMKVVTKPQSSIKNISLPKFNPENSSADPVAWCATADMCLSERPLEGSALIIVLSEALQGTASQWLSQVCFPGITWTQFKDFFLTRFGGVETSAATLINLQNSRPKDGECLAAYSNRLLSSLTSKWKKSNIEEIAVSIVLAHASQFDSRLQRLSFTTDIKTQSQLQNELKAFSYSRKRSAPMQEDWKSSDTKRLKPSTPVKCFNCGKSGHKKSECRSRPEIRKHESVLNNQIVSKTTTPYKPVTCFKCGVSGHIASKCTSSIGNKNANNNERRVDVCTVAAPSGSLRHLDSLEDA